MLANKLYLHTISIYLHTYVFCTPLDKVHMKQPKDAAVGFSSTSTRHHKPGDMLIEEPAKDNPGMYVRTYVCIHREWSFS